MSISIVRKTKLLIRWLGLVAALLVIGMVLLIFLGRQTIGQLDELRPSIEEFLSSSTGLQVGLGPLSGEWPQLVPIIEIQGIELVDAEQDSVLYLEGMRADLDLFSSIRLKTPIWREFTVDNLQINFVENASGHWRLKGFDGKSNSDLNVILRPFLYSRLIRLKSVTLNLHSFSGQITQIFGDQMLIENDADFHRAQLLLSIEKNDTPAELIVEAYGNPSDLDSFKADGYLNFQEVDFSKSLKIFTKSLMPELSGSIGQSPVKAGGEIWIDIHSGWRIDYWGELSLSEVPLDWLDSEIPPVSDIRTLLTGWYLPGSNWGARLKGLQFDLGGSSIEPIDLLYSQNLGSNWQEFDISINNIDIAILSELLDESKVLSSTVTNSLKSMDPQGNLSTISMGRAQADYYLYANLENCNIEAFKGIPGLKGIDGYLELHSSGGLFHIADTDGFEMLFPKSYREFLTFDQAQGTIYFDWPSEDLLIIRSDHIKTTLPAGDSQLVFSIEQPRRGDIRTPEFNLMIGAYNLDLSQTSVYLPYTMPEKSSNWMRRAIKEGNLKQFGLLFRSGPPKNNYLSRTTQLLFDSEQASVKFNPDWPQLDELKGLFLVDSGTLSAQVLSARLGQAEVDQTRIEYSVKEPLEKRKWIIDGHLKADLSDMINVLVQSPLNKNLGPMANWTYAGETSTKVYIELPAVKDQSKKPITHYQITSKINNAKMAITGSPINLEGLSGDIEFTPQKGIYSENLQSSLWGLPFSTQLFKLQNQQKLSFDTAVSPNNLNRFIDFPWPEIISGNIPIQGTLAKGLGAHSTTTFLDIESGMQGVVVDIPAPIGKSLKQSKPLALRLHFNPSLSKIEGKFGDKLLSDMRLEQGALKRGILSYDRPITFPDQNTLLISAHLPTIDLQLWQPLRELMAQNSQSSKTWETLFDVNLDRWNLSNFQLTDIKATIKPVISGIQTSFTSDFAEGTVTFPRDNKKPANVSLTRLQLPESQNKKLTNMDPRQLMGLDFSVDWLSIAGRDLGSLSFELSPTVSGASFNNISGNILGLKLGIYSEQSPTEFFWNYDGQKHSSKVLGPIEVDNIGDLFSEFEMPQVLDSQSGKLFLDLEWQAEPWALNKENIQGDFKVSLTNGSFYSTPGGAETALKLVGLFNFANWLRRLELDFSDVVNQNLAYDSLDGTLTFDQAVFSLDHPLKMKMPSGRMSMAGDFDMIHETVDARLVATLPVATNLPWLFGLTGGLPAALGVYVTSKLVEKQVDRLSSISYKLSGPWDDVEVAVDAIFAAELPE